MNYRFACLRAVLLLPLSTLCLSSFSQEPALMPPTWYPSNGSITSIEAREELPEFHIGGSFSYWDAPLSNTAVAVTNVNGIPDLGFASHLGIFLNGGGEGVVETVMSDQDGGWFVGGTFTSIGGNARANLARLNANGSLSAWSSAVSISAPVQAIGVYGNIVIVAGGNKLYGLDRVSGESLWTTNVIGQVRDIEVNMQGPNDSNPWALVAGRFTSLSSPLQTVPCNCLGMVSLLDGMPMMSGPGVFNSNGTHGSIRDIELAGDRLYVCGEFDYIAETNVFQEGLQRHNLAAFDLDIYDLVPVLSLVDWVPFFTPQGTQPINVYSVEHHNGNLYVGGQFSAVNGMLHVAIASFDASGTLRSWDPGLPSSTAYVTDILGMDERIHVSGIGVGTAQRYQSNSFNENTGQLEAWYSRTESGPKTLVNHGGSVLIGGGFTKTGQLAHDRVTSLNASDCYANAFTPPSSSNIDTRCLARQGDTLWVGNFSGLRALHSVSGALLDIAVTMDGAVDALQYYDGVLYMAGQFDHVNGMERKGLAAYDVSTGTLLPWSPLVSNSSVRALLVTSDRIYVNGPWLQWAGGPAGQQWAAFDRSSGLPVSWSPPNVSLVRDMEYVNGRIYIAGQITLSGTTWGVIRVDPVTGQLDAWSTTVNSGADVYSVAAHGDDLFVGGTFSVMGGQPRSNLAVIDLATGEAGPWTPNPNSRVEALAAANGRLYVGGNFSQVSGVARTCFAMYALTGTSTITANVKALLEGASIQGEGLMRDELRGLASFPTSDPYPALGYVHASSWATALDPALLSVTGGHAIVDWVVVELRSSSAPGTVVSSQAGLLRRDGSIVSPSGGTVQFPVAAGDYHVSIHHRNHLAICTAQAYQFGPGSGATIDLSEPTTLLHGTQAGKLSGGKQLMWCGDTSGDGVVRYTGAGNDRDRVLQAIGGVVPTQTVSGYRSEDVNLDGLVRYTGAGNDRDVILQNIGGVVPTNTRSAQLP